MALQSVAASRLGFERRVIRPVPGADAARLRPVAASRLGFERRAIRRVPGADAARLRSVAASRLGFERRVIRSVPGAGAARLSACGGSPLRGWGWGSRKWAHVARVTWGWRRQDIRLWRIAAARLSRRGPYGAVILDWRRQVIRLWRIDTALRGWGDAEFGPCRSRDLALAAPGWGPSPLRGSGWRGG